METPTPTIPKPIPDEISGPLESLQSAIRTMKANGAWGAPDFEGFIGDVTVQVWYDYQPAEDAEPGYSGCDAKATITRVEYNGCDITEGVFRSVKDKNGYSDLTQLTDQAMEHAERGYDRARERREMRADFEYERRKDAALERRATAEEYQREALAESQRRFSR